MSYCLENVVLVLHIYMYVFYDFFFTINKISVSEYHI